MNKNSIIALCMAALFAGCASEFNSVYKSDDKTYKYEYAKQCFAQGKFNNAVTLLSELVTAQKGRENAQESLYMLAMAEYCNRDYESASATFKKYFQSYPKGDFAEQASFYVGQSLYANMPDPRLDQASTVGAINAYQNFMDEAAEKLGGDFFILPSSIHEILLVKDNGQFDRAALEQMVREVNATQVAPEDKLTDSVYHYDSKEKIFELAEKFEVRAADRDVEKAAEKETARDADLDEKPSTLAKLKANKEKIANQPKKDPVDKHKSKNGPEL